MNEPPLKYHLYLLEDTTIRLPKKRSLNHKGLSGSRQSRCEVLSSLLALLQDFRTMDWTEVYKYPTVMLQQMQQLVGTTDHH